MWAARPPSACDVDRIGQSSGRRSLPDPCWVRYVAAMNVPQRPLPDSTQQARDAPQSVPVLAIVVPTLNEAANIEALLTKIEWALADVRWQVIFVDDDAQDRTRDIILQRCRIDPRVRLVHRIGRRGLSSAVVEGILSSSTRYVAVIDADMQHDERLLRPMLEAIEGGECD